MRKTRILVVEDENISAQILVDTLEYFDYKVVQVVSSGEEAVRLFDETATDLVLMDIELAGKMNGIETARFIQSHHDVPVIYLTGNTGDRFLEEAKITDPYGYLVKPVEEHSLRATIEMAIYRHELEKRLKTSEQWLQTTLNSIGDAVISTDHDRRIKLMNPVAESLTGWSMEEALGKHLKEIFFIVHENTFHRVENPVTSRIDERKEFGIFESAMLITRDNSGIPIDGSAAPIKNDDGITAGFVYVFRDISDRRQAEEALKNSEEQLKKAKNAAEQANRAKSEFLATMSHEIRTPISGIIGVSQMLMEHDVDNEIRENISLIKNSAESLENIINDILDFSKIEAGKMELMLTDFDIRKTVGETMKTFSLASRQKGLNLLMDVDPEIPRFVKGDPDRLSQIIRNLVGNAVKFTESGEICVGIHKDNSGGESLRFIFSVKDTGIGIPKDKHEKLFKSFSQIDNPLSRKARGTGLGLSICKQIVEMMEGQIWLESEKGVGSTFYFSARFAPSFHKEDKEMNNLNGEQNQIVDFKPLRVLVAEDNLLNRKFLLHFLEKAGFECETVGNGKEVLKRLEQECFDMILMDIQMPEMDGFEATQQIRNSKSGPIDPQIPIIALTAYAMKGDRERILQAGMDDYVSKPVDMEELFLIVKRVARADTCRLREETEK